MPSDKNEEDDNEYMKDVYILIDNKVDEKNKIKEVTKNKKSISAASVLSLGLLASAFISFIGYFLYQDIAGSKAKQISKPPVVTSFSNDKPNTIPEKNANTGISSLSKVNKPADSLPIPQQKYEYMKSKPELKNVSESEQKNKNNHVGVDNDTRFSKDRLQKGDNESSKINVAQNTLESEISTIIGITKHVGITLTEIISQNLNYYVEEIAISPDNRFIAGVGGYYLYIFQINNNKLEFISEKKHANFVYGLAWSSNYVLTGCGYDQRIFFYEFQDNYLLNLLYSNKLNANIYGLAVSKDNKYIAVGLANRLFNVFQYSENQLNLVFQEQFTDAAAGVDFSYDNKYVAVASLDRMARIYEIYENKLILYKQQLHNYALKDVSFSPNRNHFATVGNDGYLRIYDISQTNMKLLLEKLLSSYNSLEGVAFFPNGNYIAVGGGKFIKVFKIDYLVHN